jgi:hypothetical protein
MTKAGVSNLNLQSIIASVEACSPFAARSRNTEAQGAYLLLGSSAEIKASDAGHGNGVVRFCRQIRVSWPRLGDA